MKCREIPAARSSEPIANLRYRSTPSQKMKVVGRFGGSGKLSQLACNVSRRARHHRAGPQRGSRKRLDRGRNEHHSRVRTNGPSRGYSTTQLIDRTADVRKRSIRDRFILVTISDFDVSTSSNGSPKNCIRSAGSFECFAVADANTPTIGNHPAICRSTVVARLPL
jgi:hypothetical protein